MDPIDFGGQRAKVKVTMDIHGNNLVNTISPQPLCASWSNLADMLAMVRGWTLLLLKMDPFDFRGQRSKFKVTMDIHGNNLVNTISTKPLCASWSNLADMLAMVRGWTLLLLKIRGQRSRSQWTYMKIILWTRQRLNRYIFLCQTRQTCKRWWEDGPYWFWRSEVKGQGHNGHTWK